MLQARIETAESWFLGHWGTGVPVWTTVIPTAVRREQHSLHPNPGLRAGSTGQLRDSRALSRLQSRAFKRFEFHIYKSAFTRCRCACFETKQKMPLTYVHIIRQHLGFFFFFFCKQANVPLLKRSACFPKMVNGFSSLLLDVKRWRLPPSCWRRPGTRTLRHQQP